MQTSRIYSELESRAKAFSDIVVDTKILKLPSGEPLKLRVYIVDGSFLDIWISVFGKYSYHWERREINGKSHDNAPHNAWNHLKSFPKHFHNGKEKRVVESNISSNPGEAIEEFLEFIREVIVSGKRTL